MKTAIAALGTIGILSIAATGNPILILVAAAAAVSLIAAVYIG